MALDVDISGADDLVAVENSDGAHPVVLVCEHASRHVPEEYGNLGLTADHLTSHIAWDPGALETARQMSALLDAPLIHGRISRLIYDCNRPPEAKDAIPEQSEATPVPGNANLSTEQRNRRIETFYRPFEKQVSDFLDTRGAGAIVVTIHSFTPVYLGKTREVEVGILHDEDTRLADAVLNSADAFIVRRNDPYGPEHGVTHTLKHHALPRGLLNVMIEVRNDLITTPDECATMAGRLSQWMLSALEVLDCQQVREASL
ncbi:MAG: N-formylglutamate amidohydrolase [Pseudomonadota bacterium]